jgi:hypothetical protein
MVLNSRPLTAIVKSTCWIQHVCEEWNSIPCWGVEFNTSRRYWIQFLKTVLNSTCLVIPPPPTFSMWVWNPCQFCIVFLIFSVHYSSLPTFLSHHPHGGCGGVMRNPTIYGVWHTTRYSFSCGAQPTLQRFPCTTIPSRPATPPPRVARWWVRRWQCWLCDVVFLIAVHIPPYVRPHMVGVIHDTRPMSRCDNTAWVPIRPAPIDSYRGLLQPYGNSISTMTPRR